MLCCATLVDFCQEGHDDVVLQEWQGPAILALLAIAVGICQHQDRHVLDQLPCSMHNIPTDTLR